MHELLRRDIAGNIALAAAPQLMLDEVHGVGLVDADALPTASPPARSLAATGLADVEHHALVAWFES